MAEVQTRTEAGETTQIFVEFVMMQAQNAALCLGQITDPQIGSPQINIPAAKMFIDQLTVIQEKTRGNLNGDEKRILDSTLEQLRMAFAHVTGGTEHLHQISSSAPAPAAAPSAPSPAPAAAPAAQTPEPTPAPAAIPAAAPPPPKEEESKKRFTKSYGP